MARPTADTQLNALVLEVVTSRPGQGPVGRTDWRRLREAALGAVGASATPAATAEAVAASLRMAHRLTGDARIAPFVAGPLADAVSRRRAHLRLGPVVSARADGL